MCFIGKQNSKQRVINPKNLLYIVHDHIILHPIPLHLLRRLRLVLEVPFDAAACSPPKKKQNASNRFFLGYVGCLLLINIFDASRNVLRFCGLCLLRLFLEAVKQIVYGAVHLTFGAISDTFVKVNTRKPFFWCAKFEAVFLSWGRRGNKNRNEVSLSLTT